MLEIARFGLVEFAIDPFFRVIFCEQFFEFLLGRHKYRFVVP